MRPAASFSTPIGEIENTFIELLGISVGEVMQRLVTDEVLHEADARHIHRLLATNDTTARDAVMQLEQAGGSSSRRAVECFRREVISLFQQELPFVPSKKGLILKPAQTAALHSLRYHSMKWEQPNRWMLGMSAQIRYKQQI